MSFFLSVARIISVALPTPSNSETPPLAHWLTPSLSHRGRFLRAMFLPSTTCATSCVSMAETGSGPSWARSISITTSAESAMANATMGPPPVRRRNSSPRITTTFSPAPGERVKPRSASSPERMRGSSAIRYSAVLRSSSAKYTVAPSALSDCFSSSPYAGATARQT